MKKQIIATILATLTLSACNQTMPQAPVFHKAKFRAQKQITPKKELNLDKRYIANRFKYMDQNNDGELTFEEAMQRYDHVRESKTPREDFAAFDLNKNGTLNQDDVTVPLTIKLSFDIMQQAIFFGIMLDPDFNKVVTKEEIQYTKLKRRPYAYKPMEQVKNEAFAYADKNKDGNLEDKIGEFKRFLNYIVSEGYSIR